MGKRKVRGREGRRQRERGRRKEAGREYIITKREPATGKLPCREFLT
jgi:hypothetical protein